MFHALVATVYQQLFISVKESPTSDVFSDLNDTYLRASYFIFEIDVCKAL